jgi:hypothetical protein
MPFVRGGDDAVLTQWNGEKKGGSYIIPPPPRALVPSQCPSTDTLTTQTKNVLFDEGIMDHCSDLYIIVMGHVVNYETWRSRVRRRRRRKRRRRKRKLSFPLPVRTSLATFFLA